jgi:pyridoxamine 5'-phosphate oxidase
MEQRTGIFAGDDPFDISQRWLAEATKAEPNDPNAIALSTVDANGMPNARMRL